MKKFKNCLRLAVTFSVFCFILTGCGNEDKPSTSGNNDSTVKDAADDAGNAVDDVADGVGDAVDDLVGNGGFDNYDDAHDYFMDTMGSYHADSKFEVRDEDKELNDYQEGSKGYRFQLYDTSKNESGELFGEFYVDATSGTIYKKGSNNSIEEYPGSSGSSGTNSNSNNTGNNNVTSGSSGASSMSTNKSR